jgi:hypothetical protein
MKKKRPYAYKRKFPFFTAVSIIKSIPLGRKIGSTKISQWSLGFVARINNPNLGFVLTAKNSSSLKQDKNVTSSLVERLELP